MKTIKFGSEDYSREELVAEIGAAMLGAHCGFDPGNMDRSAAYVSNWLKKLNDDKKLVISAAAKAQSAMDYILAEDKEEDAE